MVKGIDSTGSESVYSPIVTFPPVLSYFLPDNAVDRKFLDQVLLDGTIHEVQQGEFRRFSLDETAKTIGVANCIAVLVLEEDGYYLGHFSQGDLNPRCLENKFSTMMKQIYNKRHNNSEGFSVHVIGGTTYTEKSYPSITNNRLQKKNIDNFNKLILKSRAYVESTLNFLFNTFIRNNLNIEWLEPDTVASIGYCDDFLGYNVITTKVDYPQITDPFMLAVLNL